MEQQLSNEHRLTAVEDMAKTNKRRIEEIEKRQDDLDKIVASVSVLKADQDHIQADVKEIKSDVKAIVEKPAKRWDTLVDKIVWAVLAAVVAFLLAKIGL